MAYRRAALALGVGFADDRHGGGVRGGRAAAGRTHLGAGAGAVDRGAFGGGLHRLLRRAGRSFELRRLDRASGAAVPDPHRHLGVCAPGVRGAAVRVRLPGGRGGGRGRKAEKALRSK